MVSIAVLNLNYIVNYFPSLMIALKEDSPGYSVFEQTAEEIGFIFSV